MVGVLTFKGINYPTKSFYDPEFAMVIYQENVT